ncbi:hypothetical protein SAMD00019534_103520 [Acytostelium subglobosum LB1]|uniref:hypothetical protein n=1 Tax=Acytostelium subglobosum LB1 TaxID=1410327 RepID=UPI000644A1BB|nr:hypothetical protein SAMD00019534_103520 [Acytostelium subglobosum LB1]GAM27177.1 hypothetical protein SAMD00019534_103520 [Acytostelium subglobosum LB1]|eukprot:XP_012750057.1 hypothetical protein SAMD00019534_103520 [Acytostelium subglobosum LB1]
MLTRTACLCSSAAARRASLGAALRLMSIAHPSLSLSHSYSSSSSNNNNDNKSSPPFKSTSSSSTLSSTSSSSSDSRQPKPRQTNDTIRNIIQAIQTDMEKSISLITSFIDYSISKNHAIGNQLNMFAKLAHENRANSNYPKCISVIVRGFCETGQAEQAVPHLSAKTSANVYDTVFGAMISQIKKRQKQQQSENNNTKQLVLDKNDPTVIGIENMIKMLSIIDLGSTSVDAYVISAHLLFGREAQALKVFQATATKPKQLVYYNPLLNFLNYYVSRGRHVESITFFSENIKHYIGFLESRHFLTYLMDIRRAGLNEDYLLDKLREDGLLPSAEHPRATINLAVYMLETGRHVEARKLYNRYLTQGGKPEQWMHFQFMREAVLRGDFETAMSWLVNARFHNFVPSFATTQSLVAILLDKQQDDLIKEFTDMVTSAGPKHGLLPKLIVFNEFSTNPARREFAQTLIARLKQVDVLDQTAFTNQIIRCYLQLDQYERALLWHGRRITELNLPIDTYNVYNFMVYHKRHQDHALEEYWNKIRTSMNIDRSYEDKAKADYDVFSFLIDLDALANLGSRSELESLIKKPSSQSIGVVPFVDVSKFEGRRVATPLETKLLDAIARKDYGAAMSALTLQFAVSSTDMERQIPIGTSLLQAATLLQAMDDKKFLAFLEDASKVPVAIKQLLFNPAYHANQLRTNLENELRLLATYPQSMYIHSTTIWNSIFIGLILIRNAHSIELANKVYDHMIARGMSTQQTAFDAYADLYCQRTTTLPGPTAEMEQHMCKFAQQNAILWTKCNNFIVEYLLRHNRTDEALAAWNNMVGKEKLRPDFYTAQVGLRLALAIHPGGLPSDVTSSKEWEGILRGVTAGDAAHFHGCLIAHLASTKADTRTLERLIRRGHPGKHGTELNNVTMVMRELYQHPSLLVAYFEDYAATCHRPLTHLEAYAHHLVGEANLQVKSEHTSKLLQSIKTVPNITRKYPDVTSYTDQAIDNMIQAHNQFQSNPNTTTTKSSSSSPGDSSSSSSGKPSLDQA